MSTDADIVLAAIQCSIGLVSEGHLDQAQELMALLYQRVAQDATHPQAELVNQLRQPPWMDWCVGGMQ